MNNLNLSNEQYTYHTSRQYVLTISRMPTVLSAAPSVLLPYYTNVCHTVEVAFCCNLGGPDKIVNPKWETALDNLPGTDC
jgi:hypothetical protein